MGLRASSCMLSFALLLIAVCGGCRFSTTGKNITGVALHQQGRYDEAIMQFQEAVAQDPTNADGYYNLASSYHGKGKVRGDQQMLQQAEQLYLQCLNISGDHPDCHRALACLLVETGRSDKAFTLLQRWTQRSPQVIDSHIELARLYQEFGDNPSAIRHLEQAVTVDSNSPHTARALSGLANLREQQGDLNQALQNYYRAQQLNPYQPGVSDRIASLQRAMGGPPANAPGGNDDRWHAHGVQSVWLAAILIACIFRRGYTSPTRERGAGFPRSRVGLV